MAIKASATITLIRVNDADSIEIGGRNLILNSNEPNLSATSTSYPCATYEYSSAFDTPIIGDTYIWSVNATISGAEDNGWIGVYYDGSTHLGDILDCQNGTHTYSETFVITQDDLDVDPINRRFRVYSKNGWNVDAEDPTNGITCVVNWVKLEKGNRPSDWTPAPEDTDQKLDDQKVELQSSIDTAIETSEDGIINTVTETFTTKDDFQTEVGLLQTQLTQTQEDFTFQFNTVNSSLTDLDAFKGEAGTQLGTIMQYIRFLNGDILLGGSDSDVQLKIENDRIAFLDNNNEVMYISNEELYIMRAIIATQLTIGNFSWVPRSNGNVSFRYIGD